MLKTALAAMLAAVSVLGSGLAESQAAPDDINATKYRSMQIDGLSVAYREADPPDGAVR